ncbi:MAG: hypothetical protein AAF492_07295, partial [Verrucomicrobiota bacterium]
VPAGCPRYTGAWERHQGLDKNGKPKLFSVAPPTQNKRDENLNSLGFLLEADHLHYYIGGDLESSMEDALIPYIQSRGGLKAMNVSHHGSARSTSSTFLDSLNPVVGLINVGVKKFGSEYLPSQRTVDRLYESDTIQNFYLTACGVRRDHIPASKGRSQNGAKARVAGESALAKQLQLRQAAILKQDQIPSQTIAGEVVIKPGNIVLFSDSRSELMFVSYWDDEPPTHRVKPRGKVKGAGGRSAVAKALQQGRRVIKVHH